MNLQCFNFAGFEDDTVMGWEFNFGGVDFTGFGQEQPYAFPPFINESGDVKGLQFMDDGIKMVLPNSVPEISLTVASFTRKPLIITAYDSQGNVVATIEVPGDNEVHNVSLVGDNISSITITGGGNEGVLIDVCAYSVKINQLIEEYIDPEKAKNELEDLIDFEGMPDDIREIITSVDGDIDGAIMKIIEDITDYYDRPLEDIFNDPRLSEFERIMKEIEAEQGSEDDDKSGGSSSSNSSGSFNGINFGGGLGLNFKIDWKMLRCFFRNLAKEAFIGWVADIVSNLDPISSAKEKVMEWAAAKLGIAVAALEKIVFWVGVGKSIYAAWYLCHQQR